MYQLTSTITATGVEHNNSFTHKLSRIHRQETFRQQNMDKYATLTKREIEIASLTVKNFNSRQMADILFISRHTVEQHRKNINRKLGISNVIELFHFALAFNLV